MQPVALPFGIGAARLHRIDDDPVVGDLHPDVMGRRLERCLRALAVTLPPVKCQIVGRFGMDRHATRHRFYMRFQIVIVEADQLGGILGLGQRVGDDTGHRLADMTDPAVGKRGALRLCARRAVQIDHDFGAQMRIHTARHQIVECQDQMHARCRARVVQIKAGDLGMRNRRAEEIGEQRVFRRNIIDIAPCPGQKTDILNAFDGLAFSEFFHVALRTPVQKATLAGLAPVSSLTGCDYDASEHTVSTPISPNPLKRVAVTVE